MTKNVLRLTFLFAVVEHVVAESEKLAFLPRRLGGGCSKCVDEAAPEPWRFHLYAQELERESSPDEAQYETRVRSYRNARRHPADPYRSYEYGRGRTSAPVAPRLRLRGTALALRPRGTNVDQTFEETLEETRNARVEYYSLQKLVDRFYDERHYRERLRTARRRYVDLAHPRFSESTVTPDSSRRSGRKLRGRRN